MPDYLPRATCEALAKVHPEVREHVMAYGDLFWHRDGNVPGLWQGFCSAPVIFQEGEGLVWCPSTDDLLALAVKIRDSGHPSFPKVPDWRSVCLVDNQRGGWFFGLLDWEDHCVDSYDDANRPAPAQAIAAWLIKEKGWTGA